MSFASKTRCWSLYSRFSSLHAPGLVPASGRRVLLRAPRSPPTCQGRLGLNRGEALFRGTCTGRRSAAGRSTGTQGSTGKVAAAKGRRQQQQQLTTEEFHSFFQAQYGDRWGALRAAMARPTCHVALLNPFIGAQGLALEQLPGSLPLPPKLTPKAPAVHAVQYPPAGTTGGGYPPPFRDPPSGLCCWYWLDWASLVPPLLLGVGPGHAVLDMCAAPGGKSLVLASLLFGGHPGNGMVSGDEEESGSGGSVESDAVMHLASTAEGSQLVCNEIDTGRRRRLVGVLRDYLPEAVRKLHIRVTPHDGGAFWRRQEAEQYDRVLLDAPCSSDRHILQQAARRAGAAGAACQGGMDAGVGGSINVEWQGDILKADWSVKRCRSIAAEQAKLLVAGARALKPGGRLVYSTCSIAEVENDGVVDKVLAKAGGALAVVSHTLGVATSLSDEAACGRQSREHGSQPASGGHTDVTAGEEEALPADFAGQEKHAQQEHVGSVANLEAWGGQRTRHGWLLLPDTTGWGPIYVCVLEKVVSSDLRRVKANKYGGYERGQRAEQ